MKEQTYIISGINKLSRKREQLSRPMSKEQAEERLQREIANRKYQRYQTHTHLKLQRLDAVQLTIKFQEYE